MLKKIAVGLLTFIFICSSCFSVSAESTQTYDKAEELALNFAEKADNVIDSTDTSWHIENHMTLYDFHGNVSAYLFELQDASLNNGYIIIGDNEGRDPVLEFSFKGSSFISIAITKLLSESKIESPIVYYAGGIDYYIGDTNSSSLFQVGVQGIQELDKSIGSLMNETSAKKISSINDASRGKFEEIVGGNASSPPTTTVITADPGNYESGYSSYTGSPLLHYSASGNYVTTGMYSGLQNHCGPVCGTNLMIYWSVHNPNKYSRLVPNGNSTTTFNKLYDSMKTGTYNTTYSDDFISAIRSHFTWNAYGCSISMINNSSWNSIKSEMDNGYPAVLLLQQHNVYGNHYVLGVGYQVYTYSNGRQSQYMYIADGWSSTVRYLHYSLGYQSGGHINLITVHPF